MTYVCVIDYLGAILNNPKGSDHIVPFEWYLFTFSKNSLKIDVLSFENDIILHTGDAMMKQKFIGFLHIFVIQYITGKSCIILVKLVLY